MLQSLTIHHIRLIEHLDLHFSEGFSVLTGETGAGKSILLEALGLALGQRAEAGFISSKAPQGFVVACFCIKNTHKIWNVLQEQGLSLSCDENLILRRVISRASPLSRAFINDQPVSLNLLKEVGENLIDIHGQFEGWLLKARQTPLVDRYGQLEDNQKDVARAYDAWQYRVRELQEIQKEEHSYEADFLTHSLQELMTLDPRKNEEEDLLIQRQRSSGQERIKEGLESSWSLLAQEGQEAGILTLWAHIERILQRIIPLLGEEGHLLGESLKRNFAETEEITQQIKVLMEKYQQPGLSLEEIDDRLAHLRSIARKHGIKVSELPQLKQDLLDKLAQKEKQQEVSRLIHQEIDKNFQSYLKQAQTLSQKRLKVSRDLEDHILQELRHLKLGHAQFKVHEVVLEEKDYGSHGIHDLEFHVSTNPGAPFGPLHRVASGGERMRFLLALKVILARYSSIETLIFDEIDTGTGGSVAAAIGSRLKALSHNLQVLAVTHSPQVAVQSHVHWKVIKEITPFSTAIKVEKLDSSQHLEEIARMLSGEEITPEARAAAVKLKNQEI